MLKQRIRGLAAAILIGIVVVPVVHAEDLLVLNGNDNSLARIDLARNQTTSSLFTFAGFPNQAVVARDRVIVVASGSNQIYSFHRQSLALDRVIDTGAGTNPFAAAGDLHGNLFVSLFLTGEVVRYDSDGNETGRVAVGRSPEGLLLLGNRLLVANTGFRFSDFGYDPGTVSVLDAGTLELLDTVPVGLNPQWIRHDRGRLHVICTGNFFSVFGEVHLLDATTYEPIGVAPVGGSPGFLELGAAEGFVTDYFGGIYSYRLDTGQVVHGSANPIQFGASGYSGLAIDGPRHLLVALYDDDVVARIRQSDGALEGVLEAGDGPVSLAMLTGGGNRREIEPGGPGRRDGGTVPVILGDRNVAMRFAVRPLMNPVHDRLSLAIEGIGAGPIRLALHDVQGRLVVRAARDPRETLHLDVSTVSAGIYYLRVQQDGRTATTRVMVAR